jgi:hypothetical protein
MSRNAVIRKEAYSSDGSSSGPDTTYVIDLYEDDTLLESRQVPGKSIYYAEDVAENWENGIIKLETSSS